MQWDAPPILLNGSEKLRVVAYFAKRITKMDFIEQSVKVERSKDGGQQVSTIFTFIITLLPEALRLPKLKVNATVNLGVTDDFKTVSCCSCTLISIHDGCTPVRTLPARLHMCKRMQNTAHAIVTIAQTAHACPASPT